MKKIKIQSEYITLGQFLKFVGLISFGGMAKEFIANEEFVALANFSFDSSYRLVMLINKLTFAVQCSMTPFKKNLIQESQSPFLEIIPIVS